LNSPHLIPSCATERDTTPCSDGNFSTTSYKRVAYIMDCRRSRHVTGYLRSIHSRIFFLPSSFLLIPFFLLYFYPSSVSLLLFVHYFFLFTSRSLFFSLLFFFHSFYFYCVPFVLPSFLVGSSQSAYWLGFRLNDKGVVLRYQAKINLFSSPNGPRSIHPGHQGKCRGLLPD